MVDVSYRAVKRRWSSTGGSLIMAVGFGEDGLTDEDRALLGPDVSDKPEYPTFVAHWHDETDKLDICIM